MNKEISSNSSEATAGNTKSSQPPIAIWWLYTHNNYQKEDIETIRSHSSIESYLIGEEIGEEEETPHLQCVIKFKKKTRPYSYKQGDLIFPELRGHWGDASGKPVKNVKMAIEYCKKDSKITTNIKGIKVKPKLELITEEQFHPWQKTVIDIIKQPPDDRSIHWIWEEKGGVGKSKLAKYICSEMEGLVLGGRGSDMKYGIVAYMDSNQGCAPKIIILDVPRSSLNYISWTGIEEIKNGLFFSSKYDGKMVCYNSPHVIIFANDLPKDLTDLSADRWKFYKINDELVVEEQAVDDIIELQQGALIDELYAHLEKEMH